MCGRGSTVRGQRKRQRLQEHDHHQRLAVSATRPTGSSGTSKVFRDLNLESERVGYGTPAGQSSDCERLDRHASQQGKSGIDGGTSGPCDVRHKYAALSIPFIVQPAEGQVVKTLLVRCRQPRVRFLSRSISTLPTEIHQFGND